MEEKCIDCKFSRPCVTMKQVNKDCCLKNIENKINEKTLEKTVNKGGFNNGRKRNIYNKD